MAEGSPELLALCQREQRRLVGLLTLYVGDESVAEELAQEAMVRLWQQWARVRLMDEPTAWLTKVAVNLANSWWRRRFAETRARRRHGPSATTTHEADSAEAVAVRSAVARLPRRQRTALVLRYYARLSVREVADQMGCAEGTVKALTHQAIAALQTQLALPDLEEVGHG